MSRALIWLAVVSSIALCLWAGRHYHAARSDAVMSLRQLDVVSTDVREIASFRAAAPPESRRHRPPAGLANRLADVLSKIGLPQSALQNLTPETEGAAGATGLRKQSAKFTLDGVTLPELGRFLQEWRATEPLWTVASIDITPASARVQSTPGQATDRLLRAVLGIETVFADKEGSR